MIGAGMIGVAAASFLQREGHEVVLIEPGNPGEGTSFGNAGCLNGSSVVPMSMPGTIKNVPRWLTDPMGPLVIRWSYLPTLAPQEARRRDADHAGADHADRLLHRPLRSSRPERSAEPGSKPHPPALWIPDRASRVRDDPSKELDAAAQRLACGFLARCPIVGPGS